MSEAAATPPRIGHAEFVALMALTTSVVALATDAVMPALPEIGRALALADGNRRQLVIGSLFVGLALSQVVFGPLSDSVGRKRVILAGFGLFMLGCVVSVVAPTFEVMLVGRFVQGLGAGGPRAASNAVIRDRFSGRLMARTLSLISTVFIVVPVFAPSLGQGVLLVAGWRAVFWMFFVLAGTTAAWTWFRLPETLHPADRRPLSARSLAAALGAVVRTRVAMGYLGAGAFVFSAFLGYLTSAQQVLGELYGLGEYFPIAFGALACSVGLSSFVNSRLVMLVALPRLARRALLSAITLSGLLLVAGLATGGRPPLWLTFSLLVPCFFAVGMLFGNLNALAMEPLGHVAGMASAVSGAGSTFVATVLGTSIGQAYDGTVLPFAAGFTAFFVLAFGCLKWAEGGRVPLNAGANPAAP